MKFSKFTSAYQRSVLMEASNHVRNGTSPEGGKIKAKAIEDTKYPKCECDPQKPFLMAKPNKGGDYMVRLKCRSCEKEGSQSISWASLPKQAVVNVIYKSMVENQVEPISYV